MAIHGSADHLFDVDRVAQHILELERQGLDVSLDVKPNGGHDDPCQYVAELEVAAAWLEEHAWGPKAAAH